MTDLSPRLRVVLADRYRLERELGQGGMATVYLAHDLKHDRKVAIKVLKPELAAVLGADRFVQEIKTTAQLQHPNILPLFDSGESEGFLYYVMPYVEGETLRAKLNRETQLGIDEAVRITTEVADALQYAHEHGVVHRDIKPENILLHAGRPMVADFGIALAVSAAAGGRMTETGLSLGTPHYMSPEQATAEKTITNRSDIYSLGAVLYEMLSGNPPHTGSSAQQIIMKIIAEPVAAVTTLRKSVPPNIAAALAKALEKLPADRFDSAKAFAEALTNPGFTRTGLAAPGAAPAASARAVTYALGAACTALAALSAWGWLRPRPAPPVIRNVLALRAGQQPVGTPVAAPDGSYLLYPGSTSTATGVQLWIKRRDRSDATPIPGTAGALQFAISPDGRSLAFTTGLGDLMTVAVAGGPLTLVSHSIMPGWGVAWLDDGTIAFVVQGPPQALSRVPANGGAVSVIASGAQNVTASLDSGAAVYPAGLPDGRGLLFSRCVGTARCDLWAYDARRDTSHVVVRGAPWAQFAATGQLLYLSGDRLMAAPFNLDRLETAGPPVLLADSVADFSLSRSGTLVELLGAAARGASYQMVWLDREGRQTPVDSGWKFRLTAFANNVGWALSPSGTRLAIGVNGEEGDDIWIKPLPRGPASRLTFDPASDYRPHWMPGGRTVVFLRSGRTEGVYTHRADGAGSDSLLIHLRSGTTAGEAVVSPDGRWLLMREGANLGPGGRDIVGVRLGSDSTPLPVLRTRFDEEAIALSPDGRWLAYQSDETGRTEVFIRPFPHTDQGKRQVSSDGGVAPLWSRDGRELFYLSGVHEMMAVRVSAGTTLDLGEPHILFHVPDDLLNVESAYYTPWDVAPDGRFIMARSLNAQPASAPTIVVVENFLEELKARMNR